MGAAVNPKGEIIEALEEQPRINPDAGRVP